MVDSTWRQEHILKQETTLLTMSFARDKIKNPDPFVPGDDATQAAGFEYYATDTRALDIIIRYESILRRSYDHAFARLKELQADRPPKPPDQPKPSREQQIAELQSRRPRDRHPVLSRRLDSAVYTPQTGDGRALP